MKQLRILGAGLTLLLVASIAPVQAGSGPDKLVYDTTEDILVLLRKNQAVYKKDNNQLYAMVHERILPHFDFRAMSRLVLGQNWRNATEDQRNRFTDAFRDLLVRTYATALLKYTNEKVVYLPYHGKDTDRKVIVKTEVKPNDGGPVIPLYYNFYRKDGVWKVFDVSIEGVSLVTNYRNVYSEKIRKEGLDALIDSIRKDQGSQA